MKVEKCVALLLPGDRLKLPQKSRQQRRVSVSTLMPFARNVRRDLVANQSQNKHQGGAQPRPCNQASTASIYDGTCPILTSNCPGLCLVLLAWCHGLNAKAEAKQKAAEAGRKTNKALLV